MKAQSPTEERQVAGMTSEDVVAEHKCFWPGTLATRRTSDDRYPVCHWQS